MNNRFVIGILIGILFLLLIAAFTVNSRGVSGGGQNEEASTGMTRGSLVEKNAVIANDQRVDEQKVVIDSIVLSHPGYVVVHEDKDGKPGAALGESSFLTGGTHAAISVPLSRTPTPSESLYAVLHIDDGDGNFKEKDDVPVQSALGENVMMRFRILDTAVRYETPSLR